MNSITVVLTQLTLFEYSCLEISAYIWRSVASLHFIIKLCFFSRRWLCAIANSINLIAASQLATINWYRYLDLADVRKINRPIHDTGWVAKEIRNRINRAVHRSQLSRVRTTTRAPECKITISRIWVSNVVTSIAIWPWILRTTCTTPWTSAIHSIHHWSIKHSRQWRQRKPSELSAKDLSNTDLCRAKANYWLWANMSVQYFSINGHKLHSLCNKIKVKPNVTHTDRRRFYLFIDTVE